MNHTSSKNIVNVYAFIAIHKNGPIILMQAIRKIKHGEELLYNYNAESVGYNTEGFDWMIYKLFSLKINGSEYSPDKTFNKWLKKQPNILIIGTSSIFIQYIQV